MKRLLTAFIVLLAIPGFAQQEAQYTQFMYNYQVLNPAYAGARGVAYFTALYRQQWIGFKGAPQSKLLSFSTPLFADRIGLGFTIANHTVGIQNTWNATAAYAYHIKIQKDVSFRFGVQGNLRFHGIDFSDPSVFLREENDQAVTNNDALNQYTGNFGVGLWFAYKNSYFGASVPFFYPNEIGLDGSNAQLTAEELPHIYVMAGTMVPLSEKVHLKPAILFKYVTNAPIDLDFNVSFVYDKRITAGVSYRLGGDGSGESIDILALYQVKNIGFGVAYDLGLSEISSQTSGSIEALIRYDFIKERGDLANPRYFF